MGHSWETLIELSHAVFEKNTLPGLDYIIYIYREYTGMYNISITIYNIYIVIYTIYNNDTTGSIQECIIYTSHLYI